MSTFSPGTRVSWNTSLGDVRHGTVLDDDDIHYLVSIQPDDGGRMVQRHPYDVRPAAAGEGPDPRRRPDTAPSPRPGPRIIWSCPIEQFRGLTINVVASPGDGRYRIMFLQDGRYHESATMILGDMWNVYSDREWTIRRARQRATWLNTFGYRLPRHEPTPPEDRRRERAT